MSRNPAVELMRIFACLIVVGVHTCLSAVSDGDIDIGRQFIACLLADGVAVFWLIMGFFVFRNQDYRKLLVHTLKGIGIPMVVLSFFAFYFGPCIMEGRPIRTGFIHSADEYAEVLKKLISWSNPVNGIGHLWYLYVYIMVISIFPCLKCFTDYLDEDSRRIKIFLIASVSFFVLNDISDNALASFSHHSINALIPASIEVIWGHFLYRYRKLFQKKKYIILSMFAFVGANLVRTLIQMSRYDLPDNNNCILYWYSSIGLFCAISITVFCFSAIDQKNSFLNRMICRIASYTFLIYLLHPIVRNALRTHGFQDWLYELIFRWNDSFMADVLYTILILLSVFLVSFLISYILKMVKKSVESIIGNIKKSA